METLRRHPLMPGLALLTLGATSMLAAEERGCEGPSAREFDFWVGDWDVYNRDGGAIVGHSVVEPILDDCVLQENWEGVSGSAGTSLNFWDPSRKAWRQLWVWREGTTLSLEGRFRDDRMVMEGEDRDEDGKPRRNRITWFHNANDTVRQLWEASIDSGKTWETLFDGLYQPADAARPPASPTVPARSSAPTAR